MKSLGERIRTSGLLNPIQARYQTAPHPVNAENSTTNGRMCQTVFCIKSSRNRRRERFDIFFKNFNIFFKLFRLFFGFLNDQIGVTELVFCPFQFCQDRLLVFITSSDPCIPYHRPMQGYWFALLRRCRISCRMNRSFQVPVLHPCCMSQN